MTYLKNNCKYIALLISLISCSDKDKEESHQVPLQEIVIQEEKTENNERIIQISKNTRYLEQYDSERNIVYTARMVDEGKGYKTTFSHRIKYKDGHEVEHEWDINGDGKIDESTLVEYGPHYITRTFIRKGLYCQRGFCEITPTSLDEIFQKNESIKRLDLILDSNKKKTPLDLILENKQHN
ncbi:hypothetical protein HQ489_02640 [Candidatus Woesearchaeota archaeon]|nr:hypothetical protein [Candidatus Woesearchaeota archaeon]